MLHKTSKSLHTSNLGNKTLGSFREKCCKPSKRIHSVSPVASETYIERLLWTLIHFPMSSLDRFKNQNQGVANCHSLAFPGNSFGIVQTYTELSMKDSVKSTWNWIVWISKNLNEVGLSWPHFPGQWRLFRKRKPTF